MLPELQKAIRKQKGLKNYLFGKVFKFAVKLPIVSGQVAKMMEKTQKDFRASIKKERKNELYELPQTGMKDETILKRMREQGEESNKLVKKGQMSGAVYISDEKHWELICEAMRLNIYANPIHLDDFRFCCQLEAEVIRMTIGLYNGD